MLLHRHLAEAQPSAKPVEETKPPVLEETKTEAETKPIAEKVTVPKKASKKASK